jgi:osmoprotectant transport system substrate-binding protein
MRSSRSTLVPVMLVALGLVAAACGSDDDGAAIPEGPTIVIGAQDFGESAILAQVYGQALEEAGYPVRQQSLGGYRDLVFTSFESGDINFTPEYAASALEFLNGFAGEASGDIDDTADKLRAELESRGLVALDASPAVDSNSFVVTPDTAEARNLSAVSDLTEDLRLGGPPDCPDNASCIPGLITVYGLDLSGNFIPLDGGGPLTVAALEGGEIDVAILFSTDGVIADRGWIVLDDDRGLINADNIIPVTNSAVVEAFGDDFVALVNAVSAALDTPQLTELNRQFGIDREDADVVARNWLRSAGFVS